MRKYQLPQTNLNRKNKHLHMHPNKLAIISLLIIAAILLAGCAKQFVRTQPPDQVQSLCKNETCKDKCEGATYLYGGSCKNDSCSFQYSENNSEKCGFVKPKEVAREQAAPKYIFDANLLFCAYDKVFKKYTIFYEIRNRTENIPVQNSKMWLKVPQIDYGSVKTVQNEYLKDKVMWEENTYTYEGIKYRGQSWEIRNIETPQDLNFELIYCDPAATTKDLCTQENGILAAQGNTGMCKGQKKAEE